MKYAIKYFCPLFVGKEYPNFEAFMVRFRQRPGLNSGTSVEGVRNLYEAKLYDDPMAANAIARIIRNRHPGAVVQNVTEKDLFKARLAGR